MTVGLAAGAASGFLSGYDNYYIQLHTADPGAAGTTAIAGNATRKQISLGSPSAGAVSNDTAIDWSSGEVDTSEDYTHWSLWSLSSGGTFVWSGTMTANAVTSGDTFSIPIGDLDLAFSPIAA